MSEMRYPYAEALKVANEIVDTLMPACTHIEIAGSLRRERPDVGDIEILYIPRIEETDDPCDFFGKMELNRVDEKLEKLTGIFFERRLNILGREVYGDKNKLMRHIKSGIPVDFFAATTENWFNYLVCRTGPADSNKAICNAAIAKGLKWHPYGAGFSNGAGWMIVPSERAVFDFVGLPYKEPRDR